MDGLINPKDVLLDEWNTPAARLQRARWREMTLEDRIRHHDRIVRETRAIVQATIQQDHPDWTDAQIQREFRRRIFPKDLWERYEIYLAQRSAGTLPTYPTQLSLFEYDSADL